VATSIAPATVSPAQWSPPGTGSGDVVTSVRGSSVDVAPSIRTVTVAACAAPAPSASVAATSAAAAALNELIRMRSHPFPRGLFGLQSEAGLLASGPTSRAFPDRLAIQWLDACGKRPRSQWRVRAGLSPASLRHR